MTQLTIASRFCGPPDSANGGYVSGLLADAIEGPAEVTLRAPPPLETPLTLEERAEGRVVLLHGEQLLADGRPQSLALELPERVTLDEARAASKRYVGAGFPRCFVCGSARGDDGGLMVLPGAIDERRLVAAPWTPASDLADRAGHVDRRFVWSALDCPSWFAHAAFTPAEEIKVALLGRITAAIERAPRVGEPCVAVGWPIEKDGRRIHCASALFSADGEPLARARATWIELRSA